VNDFKAFVILIVGLVLFGMVHAGEPVSLPLGGQIVVQDEGSLSHLQFYLQGEAATRLYEQINMQPVQAGCFPDGASVKHHGRLTCYRLPDETDHCEFGIEPVHGLVTRAMGQC
jgi:hypothetical protein